MERISDDDDAWDDDLDPLGETRGLFDPAQHPAHVAVCTNDIAKLQTILTAGYNVDDYNPYETLLMVAVIRNKREAARVLLEAGADPINLRADGVGSYTPLSVAVARGHDEMARLLWTALPPERLAECEDTESRCGVLVSAATFGRTSLIEFLLDRWLAGGEVWDRAVLEAALISAARSWRVHAAMLLLDRVKTYTPETLQTALFAAVDSKIMLPDDLGGPVYGGVDYTNQELLVRRLLEEGQFDPNICDAGMPLVHHAIEPAHRIGALRAILAKGADPNAPDEKGRTPLQYIMVPIIKDLDGEKTIHETGIHLLLEHGASVAAADPEGETPLHAAAFGAPLHLFRHVLRLATNSALSATNNHGETLLHYAAAGANVSVLRYILESADVDVDLDVNAASSNGWTPLLCALALTGREEGTQRTPDDTIETARLLLSRGADATAVSAEGWSALHCLARHRNRPGDTKFSGLAEELIEKGARLGGEARDLKSYWRTNAYMMGGQLWDGFPWGFRMGRLAGAEIPGVFMAEGTTAVEWARRCRGEAVEGVLLAREGQAGEHRTSDLYLPVLEFQDKQDSG